MMVACFQAKSPNRGPDLWAPAFCELSDSNAPLRCRSARKHRVLTVVLRELGLCVQNGMSDCGFGALLMQKYGRGHRFSGLS